MAVAISASLGSSAQVLAENTNPKLLLESHVLGDISAVSCRFWGDKFDCRCDRVHSDHRVRIRAIIPAARGADAQWAGAGGVIRNWSCRSRCAAQHVVISPFGAGSSRTTYNVIDQAGVC